MQEKSNLKLWREFQTQNMSLLGSSLPAFNKRYFLSSFLLQLKTIFKGNLFSLSYQDEKLTNQFKTVLSQRIIELEVKPEQILITAGAQTALFDVLSLLSSEASSILIEQYNYVGLYHLLERFGFEVEVCPNFYNLTPKQIQQIIQKKKPQIIYIQADNSNPTGISMSLAKRELLVELAAEYQIKIIEDQAYRYLTPAQKRASSLFELDQTGTVIALGSLSKLFYPALRTGWIQAQSELIRDLSQIKEIQSLSHSNLLIRTATQLINNKQFVVSNIEAYREKMIEALSFFDNLDRVELVQKPQGGYFMWVEFKKLTQREKSQLDLLIPHGQIFNYSQTEAEDYYRIGLGQIKKKELKYALNEIKQILS